MNLSEFAGIADRREEQKRAAHWRRTAVSLAASLDEEAWDGEWYKLAFFDDGTPLGSAQNDECQIDLIAQSWAVLSGAGDEGRARQAMDSVARRLVRPVDRLLPLLSPLFDKTRLDPGYIKGYPPGIRENGGQYTHAATWSVMAFAQLGEGDKSFELFNLLNPIHHASHRESAYRYKVEPYVVAADIYSAPAHVGAGRMVVVHRGGVRDRGARWSLPPSFRARCASVTKPERSKMDRSLDIFPVLLPFRSRTRRVQPNGWETASILREPRRQSCA